MNPISFFITGTDTEIGKTTVSCALIRKLVQKGFRTAPMKPVAAGTAQINGTLCNEDVAMLMRAANMLLPISLVSPFLLNTPAAPHLAAALDKRTITIPHILSCYRQISEKADAIIVEGVGGFCVPFTENTTSADLAVQLSLPVILVVGLKLGCINHALLTAEAILARGLTLAGWVANRIDPNMAFWDENVRVLEARLCAPRLGTIPYLDSNALSQTENYLNLPPLTDGVLQN